MNRIFKYFQAGLILMALLSGGLVQAEKKDRMIPYPVQEQLEPVTASQPAPPTAIRYAPTTAEQPPPPTAIQNAPSSANQPPPPTAIQYATPTANQPPPPTSSQPAPPTSHQSTSQGTSLPDLVISEYSLRPKPPSRQAVVDVRIGVYNQGGAASGPFTVQWWPGDNFPKPGCTWRVEGLAPNGGRILQCSGYVYPGSYGRINTGVYVDSDREVQELSTRNNKLYRETQVTK